MTNEPLGIFEELQQRRQLFERKNLEIRERIFGAGPHSYGGPYAQTTNPFAIRLRMKNGGVGYHKRDTPPTRGAIKRRPIWPEAELGLNVVQVVQAVVIESGLPVAELMGPSHKKHIAWPRHVAMWSVDRYCPEYSLTDIAYMFRRDHTSVLHGIRSTVSRLERGDGGTRILVACVNARLHHIANGGA